MNRARAEAINSGFRVNLCQTGGGRQCLPAGTWEGGWILFIDNNHNGEVDDDEKVLWTEEAAAPGVTMSANGPAQALRFVYVDGPRANAQRRAANGNIHRFAGRGERLSMSCWRTAVAFELLEQTRFAHDSLRGRTLFPCADYGPG
jgi:type IV fimbrial biogenesis protein FimT